MSKAHEDTAFTPLRNYLLGALYKGAFSQREMRILLLFARNTYGFTESKKTKRRADRFECSQSEMAEELGIQERRFKSVFKGLVKKKVIVVYRQGRGRTPGVYGLNSDPETWLLEVSQRDPKPIGARGVSMGHQKVSKGDTTTRPKGTPKVSSEPAPLCAAEPTEIKKKKEYERNKRDEEAQKPVVEITTVEQAKAAKNLTRDELKKSASWFIKHFWRRPILSVIQEHDLAAFFDANPDVEARLLMAILILAAEGEMKTRTLRKQNGQEQFVSKRPIDTTIENAKTLLAEKLMTVREQQSQAEHYEDWTDPEPDTRQRRESATIHPLTTKTTQPETKEQQQWTDSTPRWKCG